MLLEPQQSVLVLTQSSETAHPRPYQHDNNYNDAKLYTITLDPLILPSFDMSLPIPSPALSPAVRLAKIPDLDIIIGTTRVFTS
jgi:hypothetical protein